MATMGKGFLVQAFEPDDSGQLLGFETLYWEALDGLYVLKSSKRRLSADFDQPGLSWVHVSELPAQVEYIGNYPMPSGIR